MEIEEIKNRSVEIRKEYHKLEEKYHGSKWTIEEDALAFLTDEKLVIVGAGGAIGSTMVQTALTMKLTPNVCLYDVVHQGMEGVLEEMFHCGYDGVNLTATTDVAEAFKDAKYIQL